MRVDVDEQTVGSHDEESQVWLAGYMQEGYNSVPLPGKDVDKPGMLSRCKSNRDRLYGAI